MGEHSKHTWETIWSSLGEPVPPKKFRGNRFPRATLYDFLFPNSKNPSSAAWLGKHAVRHVNNSWTWISRSIYIYIYMLAQTKKASYPLNVLKASLARSWGVESALVDLIAWAWQLSHACMTGMALWLRVCADKCAVLKHRIGLTLALLILVCACVANVGGTERKGVITLFW